MSKQPDTQDLDPIEAPTAATGGPEASAPQPPAIDSVSGRLDRGRPPSPAAKILDGLTRTARRLGYRSLFYSLRLRGSFPLKLLASPDDLWPGDAERGAEIARGAWRWGGYEVRAATPPFDDTAAPESFRAWLHSFRWLRDVAALHDNRRAITIAEPAVRAWLEDYAQYDPFAWRADLVGERITHWITYAPLILSGHDLVYRSKVLNGLARQARHLNRAAGRAADGLPRLRAIIGLLHSALLLPGGENRLIQGKALLDKELGRLVLADGGFATRNPFDVYEALKLMIGLRAVFRERHADLPENLQIAIDRMVPMLKGLMLPDGALASMNGARPSPPRLLELAFDLAECQAKPIENAPMTGYQRLARGKTVALLDAGPPPPEHLSHQAHAGPLSFELAVGPQRLVVNCGGRQEADNLPREIGWMSRSTGAHSTLTLDNTNAAQIRSDRSIGPGPTQTVWTRREGESGIWLDISHDGYRRRFGALHQRRLFLSADGLDLRGEDQLLPAARGFVPPWASQRAKHFDIRFHLHPDIEATPTRDGQSAILRFGHSKKAWIFRAKGAAMAIEDSLYLEEGGRSRKNQQLVVSGDIAALPATVNWSFRAMDGKA